MIADRCGHARNSGARARLFCLPVWLLGCVIAVGAEVTLPRAEVICVIWKTLNPPHVGLWGERVMTTLLGPPQAGGSGPIAARGSLKAVASSNVPM